MLRLQTGAGEPFLFVDGISIPGSLLGALIRAHDEAGIAALFLGSDDTIAGSSIPSPPIRPAICWMAMPATHHLRARRP